MNYLSTFLPLQVEIHEIAASRPSSDLASCATQRSPCFKSKSLNYSHFSYILRTRISLSCLQQSITEPNEFSPKSNPIYLRSILISSSQLCLFTLNGLSPSHFPTAILYAILTSSIRVNATFNQSLITSYWIIFPLGSVINFTSTRS